MREPSPHFENSLRPRVRSLGALVATSLALASCGGAAPPPAPPIDAGQTARQAEQATRLQEPARVIFEWAAREQGGRFQGRGVARLEPPYRARLDLFLPGGETVARAALVGGDLRIPAGVPPGLIPPPRMLWAAVGVLRPGAGAALLGGTALEGGRVLLRYGYASGEELRYTLRGGAVEGVELLRGGDVVESVELTLEAGSRYPARAVYRNLTGFRELRITRESWEAVESYPPDIWNPGS